MGKDTSPEGNRTMYNNQFKTLERDDLNVTPAGDNKWAGKSRKELKE